MQTTGTQHHHAHAPSALPTPFAGPEKLPGIRHIIAVGSGKGGVGKSTVSVNLAFALQQLGYRIGLMDADVLGPSIPGMLGLPTGQPPAATADQKMVPAERYGLKTISMGMFTGDDNPAILRGPMVGKYLKMFVGSVQWGQLDYLILDLPPGTGDTQLTFWSAVAAGCGCSRPCIPRFSASSKIWAPSPAPTAERVRTSFTAVAATG
jgi:ATP-binding protein involved in chromosome partitioning